MRIMVAVLAIACCGAAPPGAVQVGGCSGTLVYRDLVRVVGVTAAHCGGKVGGTVQVILQDGTVSPGTYIAVDHKRDLALFSIPHQPHSLATVTETAPKLGSLTSHGRNGPTQLTLTGPDEITDSESGKKYQRMGYRVRRGKYRNGDSGSGVYSGGSLVGVASHGEDDKELFAASHGDLLSFLKIHKAFGHGPEGSDWGDKDRTREILALKARLRELEEVIKNLKGLPGPRGPVGLNGQPGTAADTSGLSSRLTSLERWRSDFKATIRVRLRPVKE